MASVICTESPNGDGLPPRRNTVMLRRKINRIYSEQAYSALEDICSLTFF
jgi:hypothetical protein